MAEERPQRDRRLYTPGQLIRLLNDWSRFADTLAEAMPPSGYGASFGRSGMPDLAEFERLAGIYAEIDHALTLNGPAGKAVRLYFQGILDTDRLRPDGQPNPTFGLFVRRGIAGVRQELHCETATVGPLIRAGVRDLVIRLCWYSEAEAEEVLTEWWEKRNYGWAKVRT